MMRNLRMSVNPLPASVSPSRVPHPSPSGEGASATTSASDPRWGLAVAPPATDASERGWIQSRPFDLGFFSLSPLAGIAVVLAALGSTKGMYVVLVATYLVAIPHYVSSFSFYLGDENLSYYRTRRAAFFVGPVVIIAAVFALRMLKFDAVVQSTMYVWNVYHVSLQSAGILSIYRRLNGGLASEKSFAHASILCVNSTMAFWHIDRFPPLYDLLHRIHFPVWTLRPLFLSIACVALAFYLSRLIRRDGRITTPEIVFLISTLALFNPYLWVHDLNLATFGMLIGHFLQYLGIVWLLNRRKYSGAEGSYRQNLLSSISASTPLLLGTISIVGLVFYLAQKGSAWFGVPITYVIVWNALTLVHFYLDGLIWAFRNPFVRKSIGPYLTPESHMVLK